MTQWGVKRLRPLIFCLNKIRYQHFYTLSTRSRVQYNIVEHKSIVSFLFSAGFKLEPISSMKAHEPNMIDSLKHESRRGVVWFLKMAVIKRQLLKRGLLKRG